MLGVDLLQSVINVETASGNLVHPLGPNFGSDYPIVQYVDDTFFIMLADTRQLTTLKTILQTFASSIGLKVNFAKRVSGES